MKLGNKVKPQHGLSLSAGFFVGTYFLIKLIFGQPQDYIIGREMPRFDMREVSSREKIFRSEDMKSDKYKILNFFASWCGMCKLEHPFLMELNEKGEIEIYGIDYMDTREKAQAWLDKNGNPYIKTGFDSEGKIGELFYIVGIPTSFVISPDGRLVKVIRGPITEQVFENEIMPVIGKTK